MPKEAARGLNGIAIVISMAPDVCKTPVGPSLVPIPYPIVAIFSLATNTKPKVLFASEPAFTLDSFIQQVIGDEPGVGGGIKSGTFKMIAKPIEFSSTVKSQSQNVIRNNDKFEMNNGNTIGILIFILLGPGPVSPSGSIDAENNPPVVPETPQEAGFLKGLTDRGGEMWNDIKGMGGTLRDAVGFGENAGDFQKAWSGIWDTTKTVGKLGASAAIASAGNRMGLGDLPIVNQAENHLKEVGAAVWQNFSAGYEAAYAQGGLPQALGRGTADVGALAVEVLAGKGLGAAVKGAKGLGATVEVADALGDTAKATAKLEDAADAAQGMSKIDEVADSAATGSKAASGSPSEKVLVSKVRVKIISADEANAAHIKAKRRPPYKEGTEVSEYATSNGDQYVRVHGADNQQGAWLMRESEIAGLSPEQIKDKFALPSTPTHVSTVTPPPNTIVREGIVGGQAGWGAGGGTQIELQSRIPASSFGPPRKL